MNVLESAFHFITLKISSFKYQPSCLRIMVLKVMREIYILNEFLRMCLRQSEEALIGYLEFLSHLNVTRYSCIDVKK